MVVDKILRRHIRIGGVETLVVYILRFWGVRGEVLWEKMSAIDPATA